MIVISLEDPARDDVRILLEEHLADMYAASPAESVHALDLEGLRGPDIRFFTIRDSSASPTLLGCAALRHLAPDWAELKSMRTVAAARGRGIAADLLVHLLDDAERRGVQRISLETGSEPFFAPARRLYLRHGFEPCPPYAGYIADDSSVFLSRELGSARTADQPR